MHGLPRHVDRSEIGFESGEEFVDLLDAGLLALQVQLAHQDVKAIELPIVLCKKV